MAMGFIVLPLKFSPADRVSAIEPVQLAMRHDAPAATAEAIREVERGRGFLLGGVRDSGKTSLLHEVSFHFNWQVDKVLALGPLSLRFVAQHGLDSLATQLHDWFRENRTRLPYTLPSSYQPKRADLFDAWLPLLKRLIDQRNANTLLLLLDDLDSVPLEDRAALLQDIQDSSWAKIAPRAVLGCARSLSKDEITLISADENYDSYQAAIGKSASSRPPALRPPALGIKPPAPRPPAPDIKPPAPRPTPGIKPPAPGRPYFYGDDEIVQLNLRKDCAIELLNAMVINLGIVRPSGKKSAKGKGGDGYEQDGKSSRPGKPGKPGRHGKSLRGGNPNDRGKPLAEAVIEEDVNASVYAPLQAAPENEFLVLVYAHLPVQAAAVEQEAKAVAPDATKRLGRTLNRKIKRGTKLTFNLTMPGLEIDEPSQSLVWRGELDAVQFSVNVPAQSRPRTIVGTVIVCEGSVPIGHLKFSFKVVTDSATASLSPQPVLRNSLFRYGQAFISYASADRAEVLKRVQILNASKVSFFQDLLTLEPGDRWEKLIYEYIDRSDVFFLFWSKAASESDWVKKEIEYARKRQGGSDEAPPEILPIILEGPPIVKAPAGFGDLHFNDKFIYFIKAEEEGGA